MTKVGELIQKGREENNLSMRQLADLAKVSHSDISRIESGEREVPNLEYRNSSFLHGKASGHAWWLVKWKPTLRKTNSILFFSL